jgi:transcriptional regulator of arginine metabolism
LSGKDLAERFMALAKRSSTLDGGEETEGG